jgi:hypothetical protein
VPKVQSMSNMCRASITIPLTFSFFRLRKYSLKHQSGACPSFFPIVAM